jgi:hypothetical protein
MPFVKIDVGIVDSSLWPDEPGTRLFVTALCMATPHELTTPAPQLAVRSMDETGWIVPPDWYGLVRAAGAGIIRRALLDDPDRRRRGRPRPRRPSPDPRLPRAGDRHLADVCARRVVGRREAHYARQVNRLRRHLTRAQLRDVIAGQLRDTPQWADARIARALGTTDKTVRAPRRRLEATSEIPRLTTFEGEDGKARSPRCAGDPRAATPAADGAHRRAREGMLRALFLRPCHRACSLRLDVSHAATLVLLCSIKYVPVCLPRSALHEDSHNLWRGGRDRARSLRPCRKPPGARPGRSRVGADLARDRFDGVERGGCSRLSLRPRYHLRRRHLPGAAALRTRSGGVLG